MPQSAGDESQVFTDRCPSCGATLKLDAGLSGPLSRCPSCGAALRVVTPKARRSRRAVDDSLGRIAFWVCGIGVLLLLGSLIGLFATDLGLGPPSKPPRRTPAAAAPPPRGTSPAPAPAKSDDAFVSLPRGLDDTDALARPTPPPSPPAVPPTRIARPESMAEVAPRVTDAAPASADNLKAVIAEVRADMFAYSRETNEGPVLWRPAPIGWHYVFVTWELTKRGRSPVALYFDPRRGEGAIRLANRGDEFASCLGRVTERGSALLQFDADPWLVPGTAQNTKMTVCFLVPDAWKEGRLRGPGFDSGLTGLPLPDEPYVEPLRRLSGWWVRAPEQSFRMYYVNPVMDALTQPDVRRLHITASGGEATLALPFADIEGTLSGPGDGGRGGELRFALRLGRSELEGRALLAGKNDVLVLYASNEPFDQVIYVRDRYR